MAASKQPWEVAENYEYLKSKTPQKWGKGWAWEFIRRSPAYRQAWESFSDLRATGDGWLKKQKAKNPYPPLFKNETIQTWRQRALDQMYVAEMLTDTKLHARKWNLAELYDPSIPYDATKIRFVFPLSPAPLSYGYKLNMDSHYLNDLQDLQNDLRQLFSNGAIITVFDPTLPADVQLKAYKKTHRAVRRVVDDYKLPYEHWASMIRVLDAWDCQNSNMTEIARKIGISTKGELTKKAHDLKSQTLEMVDSGYRRILFNLMKAESA